MSTGEIKDLTTNTRSEKLKRSAHILAGIIILLHGYERFESGHGPYLFFLVAGGIFLVVAIFHHLLAARFPFVDIIFFSIEGILSLVIAYEYAEAGKRGLPLMYLLAGILQITGMYIFSRKRKRQPTHH